MQAIARLCYALSGLAGLFVGAVLLLVVQDAIGAEHDVGLGLLVGPIAMLGAAPCFVGSFVLLRGAWRGHLGLTTASRGLALDFDWPPDPRKGTSPFPTDTPFGDGPRF